MAIEGDAAIAPQRSLASAAVTRPNTGKNSYFLEYDAFYSEVFFIKLLVGTVKIH